MSSVAVQCLLDRENNTVTIILHDIPMDQLEKVLRDVATTAWRTNVIDGIRGQYVAGQSWGTTYSKRHFHVDADETQENT